MKTYIFTLLFCISIIPLYGMEKNFSLQQIIPQTGKEYKISLAWRVQNFLNKQQLKLNEHSYKFKTQNSIDSFQDRINSVQELLNQNSLQLTQVYRACDEVESIRMDLNNLIQIIANRKVLDIVHKRNKKLKKSQDKLWKKTLSYLSAAGIFTGIGIYSYYKFSAENWCRPLLIGLNSFAGATCSVLAYKNWKQFLLKKNN